MLMDNAFQATAGWAVASGATGNVERR
jgi:hypothetical protein